MLLSFSALVLACQLVFAAPISFEHDTVNVNFPRMGSGAPSLGVTASIPWRRDSHNSVIQGFDGEGDAAPAVNGVIEGLRPAKGSDLLR